MKLLSDAAEYALRAVVWLAQRPKQAFKVKEIAEGTHAAPGYLIKVLQDLARAGIITGQRGSRGGFTLVRDPADLTALEIINAVDPIQRIHVCPLNLEAHSRELCPMHRRIDDAMALIEESFQSSTIHHLITQNTASQPMCEALLMDEEKKPSTDS